MQPKSALRRGAAGFGVCAILGALLLSGCDGQRIIDLDMKTLFTLSLGKGEDQLDLLDAEGVPSAEKTRLFMRNGLFYISSGYADKVMEFSSYGDILSLLYNADDNPKPVLLATGVGGSEASTREAHAYPLHGVGEVTVSKDKMILVEDRVPPERQQMDSALGAILDGVVLRFSDSGQYLDYIGQEGVGGTPFPYIERLQTNSQGDLIVICRTAKVWFAFWYSSAGALLYKVRISTDDLPLPKARGVIGTVETMFADPDRRMLYLKLDYYVPDSSNGVNGAVDYLHSSVYWMNAETQRYVGHVDLPKQILEAEPGGFAADQRVEVLYQLVGVASGGFMYLLSPLQSDHDELLVLNRNGLVVHRSRIMMNDAHVVLRALYLSPSGILCGLLVHPFSAQVVWWRSDRLIAGLLHEGG